MYSILPCEKIQNNIFNLKKDLSLKNKYLEQYNLLNKGLYKIYYKNNYIIKSSEELIKYFKIIEKNNYFEDNHLFLEYDTEEKEPFNFFDVDNEEEYILYENKIDEVNIQLKEFKNYCEIEFITKDLNNFNKLIF